MIVEPVNDTECLGQLTLFARELAQSTLIRSVASHLRTREQVILWFRSLPQSDDFGDEAVRVIQCDVPQRARLLPDDPNCVERAMGALMLLEALDPRTPRALATVDKPLRHTGLVEHLADGHWHAVDLFPRRNAQRNFDWGKFGGDVLKGAHSYIGKPVLKFYLGDTGGRIADSLGDQEAKLIGDKKQPSEKQLAPPPAQPRAVADGNQTKSVDFGSVASVVQRLGAGARPTQPSNPVGGGGKNAQETASTRGAGAARREVTERDRAGAVAAARGDHDSHDAGTETQRFWRSLIQ